MFFKAATLTLSIPSFPACQHRDSLSVEMLTAVAKAYIERGEHVCGRWMLVRSVPHIRAPVPPDCHQRQQTEGTKTPSRSCTREIASTCAHMSHRSQQGIRLSIRIPRRSTDPSQNTFGLYRDCRGQTCAEATSRRGNTQNLASAKDPETMSSSRPSSGECGRLVPAQGRVHASTELCLNSVRSSAF